MSNEKFTAGPWEAEKMRSVEPYPGAGYTENIIRVFSSAEAKIIKRCICTLRHGAETRKRHDAALIAAAPDMYDVLKALVEWNAKYPASQTYHSVSEIHHIGDLCNEICKNAEKILKKARGEE